HRISFQEEANIEIPALGTRSSDRQCAAIRRVGRVSEEIHLFNCQIVRAGKIDALVRHPENSDSAPGAISTGYLFDTVAIATVMPIEHDRLAKAGPLVAL